MSSVPWGYALRPLWVRFYTSSVELPWNFLATPLNVHLSVVLSMEVVNYSMLVNTSD